MGKIKVLDKYLAELIAAGEVVERPSAVVKELLENSIDADAKNITVEIKNGGIKYIRVTDDGVGIEEDDIRNAFLRHATSKIKVQDDLDAIGTLGFRGEALSSICAMSKVEVKTKTKDVHNGIKYMIAGLDELEFSPCACNTGTTIIVRDIFYNTPARMKFLKRDTSEANVIQAVVEKIALSYPQVGIKFIRDGVVKLQTSGNNDWLATIFSVFGKEFTDGLLPVDCIHNGIHVSGYLSKPEKCKSNRSFQHFFINSRYVKTKTCFVAFEEGYKNAIMIGKFPYCVLNVTVPLHEVDVNVHPAKIEVRFSNEKSIFDAVYFAVKNTLHTTAEIPQILLQHKNTISPFTLMNTASSTTQATFIDKLYHKQPELVELEQATQQPDILYTTYDTQIKDKNSLSSYSKPYNQNEKVNLDIEVSDPLIDLQNKKIITSKNQGYIVQEIPISTLPVKKISDATIQLQNSTNKKQKLFSNYKMIGEAFATYFILECDKELILIDKHAAHERLVYEQLKSNTDMNQKQQLLAPLTTRLGVAEYTALLEHTELIEQMGFVIEDFGSFSVIIREIPMILGDADIESIVCDLAYKLSKNSKHLTPSIIDDIFHSMACRSAIKAGDITQTEQIIELIKRLQEQEHLKNCPHGRPIYTKLSLYELEKLFGRRG